MTDHPYIAAAVRDELVAAASSYSEHGKLLSRDQWHIADLARRNFVSLCAEFEAEGCEDRPTLEQSDHAVAEFINAASGKYPTRTISDYTVRFYRQVAAHYENVPQLGEYQSRLSFDHFVKAVRLLNQKMIGSVQEALLRALDEHLTADELVAVFDPTRMNRPGAVWSPAVFANGLESLERQAGNFPADTWERVRPHIEAIRTVLKERTE